MHDFLNDHFQQISSKAAKKKLVGSILCEQCQLVIKLIPLRNCWAIKAILCAPGTQCAPKRSMISSPRLQSVKQCNQDTDGEIIRGRLIFACIFSCQPGMFAAPKCSKCSPGELNRRCSHRFFMSLGRCKPQSQSCSHEVSTICLMSNIEDSF